MSYKNHVTNEEVRNRIQNAIRVHDYFSCFFLYVLTSTEDIRRSSVYKGC